MWSTIVNPGVVGIPQRDISHGPDGVGAGDVFGDVVEDRLWGAIHVVSYGDVVEI